MTKLLAMTALVPLTTAFNMYPMLPPHIMTQILGISNDCIQALNATLPCDPDLTTWTLKVDQVYWQQEDVTTLCTSQCLDQASTWRDTVEEQCFDDWIRSGDKYVPAHTLSSRISEGLNMACMRSSANEWCLLESYTWTGSDVVQVDCEAFPSDPWCLNRADVGANQSRMSTLYDDELLCSECFLDILHARLTSDFLQDTDFADYLADKYQDIQSVCGKRSEPLTTRALPGYPHITEAADIGKPVPSPSPTTSGAEPTATECTGRMVEIRPGGTDEEEFLTCDDIAEQFNVASGSIAVATKSHFCDAVGEVCLPEPCELYMVAENDTCESKVASWSNSTHPVNLAQLASWNPTILGACDHLARGQYICAGPPGGAWIKPPESDIPDDSDGPVRGGPGSTASLPIVEDRSQVPADYVQAGMPSDCTRWIVANNTQAACWKLANDAKISMQRLFELNPVLGEAGENCGNQVWLGYYYCIAVSGDGTSPSPTTTSSAVPTTTQAPKPTQTQSGIVANCNKFERADQPGDGCWAIASRAGVELVDFYKWNTMLGAEGENCNTQIWPDYYYCVGVAAAVTSQAPTTTASAPLPTKTQAGFASNCKKWVEAKSGDYCWALANDNGIISEKLYELNTALGPNGENCGTQIWPEYFYCISA